MPVIHSASIFFFFNLVWRSGDPLCFISLCVCVGSVKSVIGKHLHEGEFHGNSDISFRRPFSRPSYIYSHGEGLVYNVFAGANHK
jgi:hypothetical protein